MGKNAGRDHKRAQQMGLDKVGLTVKHTRALNDVAHAMFRVGIGVIVQEENRAQQIIDSCKAELSGLRFWRFGRRAALIRTMRGALEERDMWSGRLREVTDEVARLTPDKELARPRGRQ